MDRVRVRRPDVVVHGGVPVERAEGAEPAGLVLRVEGRLQQPRWGRVRGLFE